MGFRANEGELRPLLAESGKAPVGPSEGGRTPGLAGALPNSPQPGQKPEMPAGVIGKKGSGLRPGPALDGRCSCLWPQPFSSCTSVARQSSLTAWVLRVMPTVIWGTTEKPREKKCDKNYPGLQPSEQGSKFWCFPWQHHMLCALPRAKP